MPGRLQLVLLGAVSLALGSPEAPACQICLPFPTESLADRILASEHLVLARENPDQPCTLRAVRTLSGDTTEVPQPLALFLDSSTRRRLSLDDQLSVLCGWSTESAEWRRLALHDEALSPVIRDILAQGRSWQEQPDARVRYFADYLGHEHGVLSDLAHIEVARASYDRLVAYADRIPREALLERLSDLRRMEWHALYILFLGRSGIAADQERIRREIAECAEFGSTTRTAAWATAFIEIDGANAIARLREWYADAGSRRPAEQESVLAALVVHGASGDPALQDPIVDFMGRLVEANPALAPDVTAALTEWGRHDLAEPIASLLSDSPGRFDAISTLTLRRYLRDAASAETAMPKEAAGPRRIPWVILAVASGLALMLAIVGRPTVPS